MIVQIPFILIALVVVLASYILLGHFANEETRFGKILSKELVRFILSILTTVGIILLITTIAGLFAFTKI